MDALLVEPSGACGPRLAELLVEAAEARSNKLTSSEYDETTWSARTWLTFVRQRISVVPACVYRSAHTISPTPGTDGLPSKASVPSEGKAEPNNC